ncbi:RadC family protein [Sediminibacterium sp. TEGAF015]|uniref:RadC family protein n=1 Tax=Sediminibacterium sp. TEGAF015 TaxID=575378 RepID=UPI0021FEEF7D|nr:DNA repair protein RadC [Sediminibacterium sp. TEGAF015]BDQ12148.1 DNA repair protein RadC [Sediminibacterium sp. TEGAF015]
MRKFSIKDWAVDDQPRKKLMQRGSASLSNAELLTILINNGNAFLSANDIAKHLLMASENNLQKLASMSVKDMVNLKIKGLGEAKAIAIAASLELGIRRQSDPIQQKQVSSSKDVAGYLQNTLQFLQREVFAILLLNRANRIIHFEIVSEGGITGTVADPRIILKKALEYSATGIILCHNHPSGNLKPSHADEMLTKKIKNAASFLDILVTDHIIVSHEGYFSFADEGML